ncbi:hypothetical protein DFJ77DRAFT_466207 [Powellomyces hirtus]|nr:hypothetical protein DFJ77DRAFT_466207 [Powellomyces hirtus]
MKHLEVYKSRTLLVQSTKHHNGSTRSRVHKITSPFKFFSPAQISKWWQSNLSSSLLPFALLRWQQLHPLRKLLPHLLQLRFLQKQLSPLLLNQLLFRSPTLRLLSLSLSLRLLSPRPPIQPFLNRTPRMSAKKLKRTPRMSTKLRRKTTKLLLPDARPTPTSMMTTTATTSSLSPVVTKLRTLTTMTTITRLTRRKTRPPSPGAMKLKMWRTPTPRPKNRWH